MTSRPGTKKGAPLSVLRGVAERSYFAGRRRSMAFPYTLISSRVEMSSCLYRRDLRAHYGCVNAIEFSAGDGRMIASGSEFVNRFSGVGKIYRRPCHFNAIFPRNWNRKSLTNEYYNVRERRYMAKSLCLLNTNAINVSDIDGFGEFDE